MIKSYNTLAGSYSGYSNSGDFNTVIGGYCGGYYNTGSNNIFIGSKNGESCLI